MADLRPEATFQVGDNPDWMAVADSAVWVTTSSSNRVIELNATTNRVGRTITVAKPCSGLVAGFGSLWIPSCGGQALIRADLATAQIQARIAAAPANSEGGITVGAGSVWLATSASGVLSRIDPTTNTVVASITVPSGSYCPVFAGGFVWVTSTDHNVVAKVDPSTNRVVAEIAVGKSPRFVTAGGGAVWTLNQGDGTITRVDMATSRRVADIPVGLAGPGGEIAFGFDAVWATLEQTPVTRIDAGTNAIVRQWSGKGGDSIRAGLGSIWLTNLKAGLVWRVSPTSL
jgi:virginiamycin B lyase